MKLCECGIRCDYDGQLPGEEWSILRDSFPEKERSLHKIRHRHCGVSTQGRERVAEEGICVLWKLTKEDKMKTDKPTREDLTAGENRWQWHTENPGKSKRDYPGIDVLDGYTESCPFCTYYDPNGLHECTDCPLKVKFGLTCWEKGSPFYSWQRTNEPHCVILVSDHPKRSHYANQITMVFAKELEKLEEEKIYPSEPEIFFPKMGEIFYFYGTWVCKVFSKTCDSDNKEHEALIALGVYRTKEDCERAVEIQQAKVRIVGWMQENLKPAPDSNDPNVAKYSADYVTLNDKQFFCYYGSGHENAKAYSPVGYFATSEDMKRCIEANRADFLTVWGVGS